MNKIIIWLHGVVNYLKEITLYITCSKSAVNVFSHEIKILLVNYFEHRKKREKHWVKNI